MLAIHELDETHIGRFSFRTHESFFQVWMFMLFSEISVTVSDSIIWSAQLYVLVSVK